MPALLRAALGSVYSDLRALLETLLEKRRYQEKRGLDCVGLYERGGTADERFASPHRRKQPSLSV